MGVNKVIYYGEVLVDMSQVTVTPETLGKGVTALDAKGDLITGLHECEETEPKLQSKTVTPTTSLQTVNPDSGYDGLSKVTVNAMPTATQATPSISISSAGLITAKSTQGAGYVASGTKSATKQLTTQSAKTVTPTTSNQTAVASGRYTTGAITVKGDANLKAENIKSGVSIFGVTGSYAGSGGSGGDTCTATISVAGQMAVFGYGSCDVYVPVAGDYFLGTTQFPSTEVSSHNGGSLALKRVFNNVPVGSVFTIYSSVNNIKEVSTEGDVEFAYANHSTTSINGLRFLVCRFNGTGTITVT